MAYTQEEILKKYQTLPEDLQKAIFSMDTANIIQKIAKDNDLNVEKMGILADEAGLLMLGITRPNNFISNLTSRLEIDKSTAGKIGQEINAQIFSKIRESLKKIHGVPTQEKTPPPTVTTAPQTEQKKAPPPPTLPIKEPLTIEPQRSFSKPVPKPEDEPEENLEFIDENEEKPKDIIQERNKDQIFRSKPETTEKEHPLKKSEIKELKQEAPKPKSAYPTGADPYREPLK
ncbi:hypothetical protein ACFL1O_00195 [Patescibacteria group bacterium]